ncbi:MAG: thioredoxin domain-containing protein, partial [Rhodocyclaceae bacterium]|nr:thioredoxin domain-containing protein [Rhodocyclaceae bacterium]
MPARLLLLVALLLPLPALPANRLAAADSPYLRQHAENPVDWYPWGDEAFAKAQRENKPVFLSIGYSSCYWCRVAEETLYRNPVIAARMNAGFVNVKVDREQRPDLDRLYMSATRLLGASGGSGGSGGWPNNLFLTPERKPFFAGSYFPPEDDDFGRPGFQTILARIGEAWTKERG